LEKQPSYSISYGKDRTTCSILILVLSLNKNSNISQVLTIIKQNNVKSNFPIMDGKHNSVYGLLPYPWLHNKKFLFDSFKKKKFMTYHDSLSLFSDEKRNFLRDFWKRKLELSSGLERVRSKMTLS